MSIRVTCDSCSKVFGVSDQKAGKRVRCPACEEIVTVPMDDEADEEPVLRPRRASGSKSKKKSKKSSSPPWLAIGIGGGAVVIVAVLAIVLMSGKNDPAQPVPPANVAPGAATTPPTTGAPPATTAGTTPANTTKAPVAVAWSVAVDPPPQAIEWPESWKGKVDVYGGPDDALFPTTPSPLFADLEASAEVRSVQVWDLVTGQKLGSMKNKTGPMTERRLSPDGKMFLGRVVEKDKPTKIDVWSIETGQLVRQITADVAGMTLQFADFLPGDRIVTYTSGNLTADKKQLTHRFRVFDLKSGEQVAQSDDDALFEFAQAAFSPGRRYLASSGRGARGDLVVYDLKTCHLAARQTIGRNPNDSIEAIAFSPKGDKLAVALSAYPTTRLVLLDVSNGKDLQEHRYPVYFADFVPGLLYQGPPMEWLPDASALLLGGTMALDPVSGRTLWLCYTAPNQYDLDNSRRRLPVPGGFLTIGGKTGVSKITLLPLPASSLSLAQSLSANNSVEALLKPGQKVSLVVQVDKLRFGTPEETKKVLETMYRDMLDSAGFELADDQPLEFKVTYNEAAGAQFQQGFVPNAGKPGVEGTKALVNLEWVSNKTDSLWKHSFEYFPRTVSARGELNPENVRTSMFEQFQRFALGQPLPYFLSTDKKTMLPAIATIVRE